MRGFRFCCQRALYPCLFIKVVNASVEELIWRGISPSSGSLISTSLTLHTHSNPNTKLLRLGFLNGHCWFCFCAFWPEPWRWRKWTNARHTRAKNFRRRVGHRLNQRPHCVNGGTVGQLLQQALSFVSAQLLYNEFHPLKTSYSNAVDLFFQWDLSRIEKQNNGDL